MKPGILVAIAAFITTLASASEWELKVSDADIQVYYRTTDSGYTEFKGITHINSRLSAFVALFSDVDNMPAWVYRTKKAVSLATISATEAYSYTVHEMQWPLVDRDAVLHTTLSQDPGTLAVTIKGSAEPGYYPESRNYVRIPLVESYWRFTPQGSGVVEVVFQGYGDPGGNLSSGILKWFTRLVLWEAPYRTLLGMRKMISRDVYQSKSYGFIRETGN